MTNEELCKIELNLKRLKEKHEEVLKQHDATSMEFFHLFTQTEQIKDCINRLDDVKFALSIIEYFKNSLPEKIKEETDE